jgi:small subunit ribosomal protein S16
MEKDLIEYIAKSLVDDPSAVSVQEMGSKKRPYYRIVVQDSRKPRDGTTIEEIGIYHPIEAEDKQIAFNEERARYWIGVGAQPSDTVKKLFNKKKFTL